MFRDQLVYMGLHFMIKDGKPCFESMKDKCDAIRNIMPLCTVKECQQFCGMVNFLSMFLPQLRKYLIPIDALTKKKATFKWTDECQKSFDIIKDCLQKCQFYECQQEMEFSVWKVILVEKQQAAHSMAR